MRKSRPLDLPLDSHIARRLAHRSSTLALIYMPLTLLTLSFDARDA